MAQDQGVPGAGAPAGADPQPLDLVTLLARVYLPARAGVEDAAGETQELGVQLREVAAVVERDRFRRRANRGRIIATGQVRGRVRLLGGSIGGAGQPDAVALHDAILEQGTGDVVQRVALDAEFKRDFGRLEAAAKGVGLGRALPEPRPFSWLAPRLAVVLVKGALLAGEFAFSNAVLLQLGRLGELAVEGRDVHVLPRRRGRAVAARRRGG